MARERAHSASASSNPHGLNEPHQLLLLFFVQGEAIAMGQKGSLLLLVVARGVVPGEAHVTPP